MNAVREGSKLNYRNCNQIEYNFLATFTGIKYQKRDYRPQYQIDRPDKTNTLPASINREIGLGVLVEIHLVGDVDKHQQAQAQVHTGCF